MKVLVLSHMYPVPYNEVHGIFVHEQVKALKNKGVEIRVVSPVPWTPFPISQLKAKWRKYDKVPEKRSKDGIDIYYPRYMMFPKNLFFFSAGRRMYRGISDTVQEIYSDLQFDLIHAHVALPDGFAAAMMKGNFEAPLITHIHGQDFQVTLHQNQRCKKAINQTLVKSDRIITVSDKLKKIGQEEFELGTKVKVISNGISEEKVISSAKDIELEKNGNIIILSVSNLISTKGIDLNLKALSRLKDDYPNLEYLVIGEGKEKSELKKLVYEYGMEENVSFLGRKSHRQVMEYMAKADIFSLPSWKEGLGVVYLEAMAHAKPVIACKGEGVDGIVEDGRNGILVEPNDVSSVFEALKYLLDHPKDAKKMGKKARDLIINNYTWGTNAEKTIELYGEILDGKK